MYVVLNCDISFGVIGGMFCIRVSSILRRLSTVLSAFDAVIKRILL
jgi:hypothetical protein